MLTPQEVRERSGSFEKAVFGGYNMSTVDDYITSVAEDYSALYKENAVLKSKMKVLVDRLEEYRKQEDSLNRAILTAQKTADEMTAETERKCAKMLSETEQSLRQRNLELKQELAAEAERVARAKKTANAFIEELENQVHQSLSQLERIRQMAIVPKESQKAAPKAEPKPAAAQTAAPAEETPEPQPVEASKPQEAPKAAQTPKPQPAPRPAEAPKPAEDPKPAEKQSEDPDFLSADEMSRQIELNLSRILAQEDAKLGTQDTLGDTRVIKVKSKN